VSVPDSDRFSGRLLLNSNSNTDHGAADQYEPPAITDLGSLVQITAGTGTRSRVDAGAASV
jgi:hypothetical protein